jgi:hypothetical protein
MSNTLLRSKQVSPLPVGPGGGNPTKQALNDTNVQLTMMTAQATANTKYDPPVPQPVTKAVIKENFSNGTISTTLFVVGGLFIVYGLVAK